MQSANKWRHGNEIAPAVARNRRASSIERPLPGRRPQPRPALPNRARQQAVPSPTPDALRPQPPPQFASHKQHRSRAGQISETPSHLFIKHPAERPAKMEPPHRRLPTTPRSNLPRASTRNSSKPNGRWAATSLHLNRPTICAPSTHRPIVDRPRAAPQQGFQPQQPHRHAAVLPSLPNT